MDKRRFGQPLTEEEERAYFPNLKLELTLRAENKRLRKAIDEKNKCIDKFKSYDARRKEEFDRMKENYAIMEEQYNEWREEVVDEYGKAQVKKFEKLREKVRARNQNISIFLSSFNDVEQVLPKVIAQLREMEAFAEAQNPYQETFYKSKIGSLKKEVERLLTRVITSMYEAETPNKQE